MTIPVRTPEQRQDALDRALAVRRERAGLRAELKSGARSGAMLIRDSAADRTWHSVRVSWLLQSLPGVGPARASAMLEDCGIADSRRLGGLSDRQRAELAGAIEGVRT